MTGFDVQSLNLGLLFCVGSLPITAIDNAVSPHGDHSDPPQPGLFPSCGALLPQMNPALGSTELDRIHSGFTGQPLLSNGLCAGSDRGDNIARGYITIDVVDDCTVLTPDSPTYISDSLLHENRLMADYFIVKPASAPKTYLAVHVEADPTGTFFANGDRTFYGRYTNGDATDRREPLPSVFSTRFAVDGGDTVLHIWREGGSALGFAPCGTTPPGIPIAQNDVLVFNESEDPFILPLVLPYEVNELALSTTAVPFLSGWIRLDERHAGLEGLFGDDRAQAWVSVAFEYPGGNASTSQAHQVDPGLIEVLFLDGFESGDIAAWSSCSGCS